MMGEQPPGYILVHSQRRAEHSRPDIGEVRHLQQALKRPVLAVDAVNEGKDDIQTARSRGSLLAAGRGGGLRAGRLHAL